MRNSYDSLETYFNKIHNNVSLSVKEEAELISKAKNGNKKAVDTIIKANLLFVVSVAKAYQNQGLPLEDLIGEGNFGLLKAIKKFEPNKNFKFISYAVWWIRQKILQALAEHSRIVRIPMHSMSIIYKSKKARMKLEQKYGRTVMIDEVIKCVAENERIGRSKNILMDIQYCSAPPLYLNDPANDDGSIEFLDMLPAEDEKDLVELPRNFLNCLEERELIIIKMYYGFIRDHYYTLQEIADHLRLSRERIRQLLNRAKNQLRKNIIKIRKKEIFEY